LPNKLITPGKENTDLRSKALALTVRVGIPYLLAKLAQKEYSFCQEEKALSLFTGHHLLVVSW